MKTIQIHNGSIDDVVQVSNEIPEFRRGNVASRMADHQETWVRDQGFRAIHFKTQNKFKGMLLFAIKNGFNILRTVKFDGGEGFKILPEKTIR